MSDYFDEQTAKTRKAIRSSQERAKTKEQDWSDKASKYLQAKARGEWSPWLGFQTWMGDQGLASEENRAYGGWSEARSGKTEARRQAYEEALKYAKDRAEKREQIQDALDAGTLQGKTLEQAQQVMAQQPGFAPAWVRMYPQYRQQIQAQQPGSMGLP